MSSPFDALAPQYAALWSDAPHGRSQRQQVWREIDVLFRSGDHILDIGCGIGDDALHLASRGVRVTAIDAAPQMVDVARARGVDATCTGFNRFSPGLQFDGALSNFGVFNCIADWRSAAAKLASVLKPNAPFALCVMPRFRFIEPRRWRGHTRWRGIDVYYRSHWETVRRFSPLFALRHSVRIGQGDHTLFVFARRPA